MGNGNIVVYIIVGFLGLAAAALGFAAEATKIKVSDISITRFGSCVYPSSSPASPLAYVAALITLIAAIVISSVARCGCCQRSPSNTHQSGAAISFVLSWVASVFGIGLLIGGAALNSYRDSHVSGRFIYCYALKPGVLAGGAALALAASIFGLLAYNWVAKVTQSATARAHINQPGIAMGQPHYSNPSANVPANHYPKQQQYV